MTGIVSRKSGNVNPQYRTELIELDVMNPDGALASGMYADVVFTSKGDPQGMNVPSSSVVTSTERKYVIVQRNKKLEKVDVTTGNRSAGRIQINGNLQPGEMVILNANDDIASSN